MTPIPTTTFNHAASAAAIRSRRERELSRLALAKARWKRRLASLESLLPEPRAVHVRISRDA
jgi:hypothetical protein